MSGSVIRSLAICVFRNDDRIFVFEGYGPSKREAFYRPLGGAIEFGESSRKAIARELREEIGAEVSELRYLGTLENVFTYDGKPGHEIVLVHDGEFADKAMYEKTWI